MEFADITKDVRDRADRMKRAKILDVGSCDSIIRQYNTLRELSSRNWRLRQLKLSILFVCTGNICRSPMAEGLFQKLIANSEIEIEVQSAGVSTFGGQKPSQHTLDILKDEGVDLTNNLSQPLDSKLINEANYIFAMSASHIMAIENMFPEAIEKTFLVTKKLNQSYLLSTLNVTV